jgi:hypothetical protein
LLPKISVFLSFFHPDGFIRRLLADLPSRSPDLYALGVFPDFLFILAILVPFYA